jgi:hypothetical protein
MLHLIWLYMLLLGAGSSAGAPSAAVKGRSVSSCTAAGNMEADHFFPATKVACICSVGCLAPLDRHLGP